MFHLPLVIHLRAAIVAGSTGRMAMLLLIYSGPLLGLPRIDIVSTLGSLAAPNKQDAVTLGSAIHFTMGVLFAVIYVALWNAGIGDSTWEWGMIFGAVHGIGVIALLQIIKYTHPELLELTQELPMMISILLNHMVFGLVVAIVYSS